MAEEEARVARAYRPPVEDDDDLRPANDAFYVVSPRKLAILFISTFGVYSAYWFYRQWDYQKRAFGLDVWPIPRAIFAIFFTHSLFRIIDQAARGAGYSHAWNPSSQATLYVALVLGARVLGRLQTVSGEAELMSMISIAITMTCLMPLMAAQKVINLALRDAEGSRNAAITTANAVFIGLGVLLWGLVVVGLVGVE